MKLQSCLILGEEPMDVKSIEEYINLTPYLTLVNMDSIPLLRRLKESGHIKPDIIFLDLDAQEFANREEIEMVDRPYPYMNLICYSSNNDQAVTSFDLGGDGFLLKPIRYDQFLKMIKRVRSQILGHKYQIDKTLEFNQEDSMIKVHYDEIDFIKYEINETTLKTIYGTSVIPLTPSEIESKLPDYFIKISDCLIVNLDNVSEIEEFKVLYFADGTRLNVHTEYQIKIFDFIKQSNPHLKKRF